MVNQTPYQIEEGVIAVQRQAGQLNDIAVGERLIAANADLHPILAAKNGRKQGERFDNVFWIIHYSKRKDLRVCLGGLIYKGLFTVIVLLRNFADRELLFEIVLLFLQARKYPVVQPFRVSVQDVAIDI